MLLPCAAVAIGADAEHDERPIGVFLVQPDERRGCGDAGWAPRGPEIEQDDLAAQLLERECSPCIDVNEKSGANASRASGVLEDALRFGDFAHRRRGALDEGPQLRNPVGVAKLPEERCPRL
jgi:hypothetical protein